MSERVRDDIQTRIASGELQPGSQLPAERALAEQFGVARTSVREAIQGLVALGYIERRGNRSFVVEQVPDSELSPADGRRKAMRELIEARRVLEFILFELAASRATGRDRAETLELARRPAPATIEAFVLADRQFHASIAAACGNPVLAEVYGRVLETVVGAELSYEVALGLGPDDDPREAIAHSASDHLAIAEAYAAGDVDGMLAAVEAHLGPVEGRMSGAARITRGPRRGRNDFSTDRSVGM